MHKVYQERKTMKTQTQALFLFALILSLSFVVVSTHADIDRTKLLFQISNGNGTKSGGVMLDQIGVLNGSLTASANFKNETNEYGTIFYTNNSAGTDYVRVNVTAGNPLQFGINSSNWNSSIVMWGYIESDDGTDDRCLKWGAGTSAINCYVQWSSSNVIKVDLNQNNGSGQIFYSTTLTPPTKKWFMLVFTSDAGTMFRSYLVELGAKTVSVGAAQNVSNATSVGLKPASDDARLFGSDGGGTNLNRTAGLRFYNKTLSENDILSLAAMGPNFYWDNITIAVNFNTVNGTMLSRGGAVTHTWEETNTSTGVNSNPSRLDVNNDGTEDTNITNAQVNQYRGLLENITNSGAINRVDLSLQSISQAPGAFYSGQSNFANVNGQLGGHIWRNSRGYRTLVIDGSTPSWMANTTTGLCTGTSSCPPINESLYADYVVAALKAIGCGYYQDCEFELGGNEVAETYYNNQSGWNSTNTARFINHMNVTRTAICADANLSYMCGVGMMHGPSFATYRDSTNDAFRKAVMGNFSTYGLVWGNSGYGEGYWSVTQATNYYNVTETDMQELSADCALRSINCTKRDIREFNHAVAGDTNGTNGTVGNDTWKVQLSLFYTWILNNPQYQVSFTYFEPTTNSNRTTTGTNSGRDFRAFIHPGLMLNADPRLTSYYPMWRFSTYHDYNSTVVQNTETDPYVYVASTRKNGSLAVSVTNDAFLAKNVTLILTGSNATFLTNVESGVNFALTNGVAVLTDVNARDSNTYSMSADSTGPVVTIVSPQNISYSNGTILVNFTCSDAQNNVSTKWFNNGTANTTWTTPVNVTLSDGAKTFTMYCNDTFNNVGSASVNFVVQAQLGIASTSPASPVYLDINEAQTFSYTVYNPTNASYTVSWFADGTNQTASYNASSFLKSWGLGDDGAHTVQIHLVSSLRSENYTWSVVVSECSATALIHCDALDGLSDVGGDLSGFMVNILPGIFKLVVMLVLLGAIVVIFGLGAAAIKNGGFGKF